MLLQALVAAQVACDEAERTVRQKANAVAALEAAAGSAAPGERRGIQAKLIRAREAHEQARRAQAQIKDVSSAVSQLNRTHTTTSTTQVAAARAQLSSMSRALESYRFGGASLGGVSGGFGASRQASGGGSRGTGLSDVEVSAADLDDNPVLDDNGAQGTFGKGGLSRADYRWAVQTWSDTVGPGVASGKTRDDFVARDAASNAQPLRRTADVYDMFLGSDRIRADRQPNGSLNIINGRHRLLIARELGIRILPGDVR